MLISHNLDKDIKWYTDKLGFQVVKLGKHSALMNREEFFIQLEQQSKRDDDLLIGGCVVKFFVTDVSIIFSECLNNGLVTEDALIDDLASNTIEFELTDLNGNTIVFAEERNS